MLRGTQGRHMLRQIEATFIAEKHLPSNHRGTMARAARRARARAVVRVSAQLLRGSLSRSPLWCHLALSCQLATARRPTSGGRATGGRSSRCIHAHGFRLYWPQPVRQFWLNHLTYSWAFNPTNVTTLGHGIWLHSKSMKNIIMYMKYMIKSMKI